MIQITNKTLHLQSKHTSYIMMENEAGDLLNFHYGRKLPVMDYAARPELWVEAFPELTNTVFLSSFPQEYPSFGHSDTRNPAYQVISCHGNSISRLTVKDVVIHKQTVVAVEDMPCLFGAGEGVDTLEVVLEDAAAGLAVRLYYVVFDEYDVIARHAVIENISHAPVTVRSAYSANLDLPENQYELIYFAGEWGRERGMERTDLSYGMQVDITDTTGRGSRQLNPFVMLATKGANETQGEVYGMNLVYSTNHSTVAQVDCNGRVRLQQGISPRAFSWEIAPGGHFTTPQCILCYSSQGFEPLSHTYHSLYRNHLMRSKFTHAPRPVLINNWEATYFDFNEDKLVDMAKKAQKAGIDLFVVDDGWFGQRDNARSSLGDWYAHTGKLPSGVEGLAERINQIGMQFGIWLEPEMISPDSQLYRIHPDWAVRVPQQEPVQQRWQLVLDLTRQEVCDYLIDILSRLLSCGKISYVKWDMNRIVCDVPREGFYHSYILGYYRIVRTLTERFPNVLFEGCCSGGGRFDPGVLAYMPQIWASDNSDAISRLKIQYSTSMSYPISSIGAHVTAVPNHQTGRITSLKTRADVAYCGVFGYELDITKMNEQELELIAQQTAFSKRIQNLIHTGSFHRLRSPFETNECIWQVVSQERDHVFMMACRVLSVIGRYKYYDPKVRFRGLDENAVYQDVETGLTYTGALLMNRGITIKYAIEDFTTYTLELRKL